MELLPFASVIDGLPFALLCTQCSLIQTVMASVTENSVHGKFALVIFDCPIICHDRMPGNGVVAICIGYCFNNYFDVIGVGL